MILIVPALKVLADTEVTLTRSNTPPRVKLPLDWDVPKTLASPSEVIPVSFQELPVTNERTIAPFIELVAALNAVIVKPVENADLAVGPAYTKPA
jgi:hypothetical protein